LENTAMPSSTAIDAPIATEAINPPRGAWVIYDERAQCGHYVARKFLIGSNFTFDACEEFSADTVEELRALLPAGLISVGRHESDPRSVIETCV
jgi:hypothetical protein